MLVLPITDNARKYGYIYWVSSMDTEVLKALGGIEKVEVRFNDLVLGERNVDWKYRRISVGPKWTKALPKDCTIFELELISGNILTVRGR